MEIVIALLIVIFLFAAIKLAVWILKAGVFIITLPIKIILGVISVMVLLILIPLVILPVLLAVLIPLIPVIVIGLVIILLLKFAF